MSNQIDRDANDTGALLVLVCVRDQWAKRWPVSIGIGLGLFLAPLGGD